MGWEDRLYRYLHPSVSRLAIYTDRHLNMKIRSFGTFLYKNRKEMKVWKN